MKLSRTLLLAVGLSIAPPTFANVILDQQVSSTAPSSGYVSGLIQNNYPTGPLWAGQTFTVGLNGTLSSIGFGAYSMGFIGPLPSNASILVNLWQNYTGFGLPSGTAGATLLGTVQLNQAQIAANWNANPQFQIADFTQLNIAVTSGQTLAFEVNSGNGYNFGMTGLILTNPYSGGYSFGTNVGNYSNALIFSTYVNTATVPEPATYGMILLGLGLMGFVVHRRKNEQA